MSYKCLNRSCYFYDLTWQDKFLDITSNSSSVATASAVQVRQPINNKSVGNWRKYDAFLSEVKSAYTLSF